MILTLFIISVALFLAAAAIYYYAIVQPVRHEIKRREAKRKRIKEVDELLDKIPFDCEAED